MLFYNCGKPQKAPELTLKVIVTTDVHGAVLPFDYADNKPATGSLARLSQYVKTERQNPNQQVLLFDNGDFLQGQPLVYYYNFVDTTTPHPSVEAMNWLKYDAANVGNHDIECGHPVYDRLNRQMQFPWLAANIINTQTGEPYFKPYTVFNIKGAKVAVLGLTTPAIPDWLAPNLWSGMAFDDMILSAKKWVDIIQKTEKPDVLLGLFHAGIDYTYNGQTDTTYKNENATMLVAQQVPGFDAIFAGHDHRRVIDSVNANGKMVYVIDGGCFANTAATAQLTLKLDANGQYQVQYNRRWSIYAIWSPTRCSLKRLSRCMTLLWRLLASPLGYCLSR